MIKKWLKIAEIATMEKSECSVITMKDIDPKIEDLNQDTVSKLHVPIFDTSREISHQRASRTGRVGSQL